MRDTSSIVDYISEPEEIGFVQFAELWQRHENIRLRRSDKVVVDFGDYFGCLGKDLLFNFVMDNYFATQ